MLLIIFVLATAVNGNYTEWTDFTECSKTCEGGQRSRSRTCTNPPPQNGGKDCMSLGRDVEYDECNGDVRCPGITLSEKCNVNKTFAFRLR